jgi:hypothetical protein
MNQERTYGKIHFNPTDNVWTISEAEPHVGIKIKQWFAKIAKSDIVFKFKHTQENCFELWWLLIRYPLIISDNDRRKLDYGKRKYKKGISDLEKILIPEYVAKQIPLKPGLTARSYQLQGNEAFLFLSRMLLADEIGLGKTLSAMLPMTTPGHLPALVVAPTHMSIQWEEELGKFTEFTSVIINGHKVYSLPKRDVYIIRYSCLAKWIDVLAAMKFKYIVFDECQEFRRTESLKYKAGYNLSLTANHIQGLSATPIFNYGEEIYNVMDVIKPGCLGEKQDFVREWVDWGASSRNGKSRPIANPQALGTYLRQEGLYLRRTREEVGMELPPINKLLYNIDFDEQALEKEQKLCKALAMAVLYGKPQEIMTAGAQMDMRMRQVTGISKARGAAEFVKMMIDNGESILLGGWHREVYRIWEKEFEQYHPAWYTGTESIAQKNDSVKNFIAGKTKLLIMSNRSGAGIDGIQKVCSTGVVAELDPTPMVHKQFFGRLDRPGQQTRVSAIFLITPAGSDPGIVNILGLKESQSQGIMDPLKPIEQKYTDESRIKAMAKQILGIKE